MTALEGMALPVPELVDVIPVDQADAIIGVARKELADLTHQVDEALLAAEAAERHASVQGADPAIVGRAAEQVQRFIDERRAATDRELKVLLDAASDQARLRLEEARADADRFAADSRRLAAAALAAAEADQVTDRTSAAPAPPMLPGLVFDASEVPPAIFPGHVAEPAAEDSSAEMPSAPSFSSLLDQLPARPAASPLPAAEPAPAPAAVGGTITDPTTAQPAVYYARVDGPPPTLATPSISAAPGPSEPMWLPPASDRDTVTETSPADLPARPAALERPAPPAPVAVVLSAEGPPASAASSPAAEAAPEQASPAAPEPPAPSAAPEAAAEAPVPARARLGSVPVFALLQVLGLVAVLVVLLVFVS